ncbi:hypothetical protein QLX08_000139 [Tetragonisca angustula]|uniref:Uncharacterized protein n=1 Tax=Tetragonisca angustula TaxID=166442 RepID=A0AAW1AMI3_9HYME
MQPSTEHAPSNIRLTLSRTASFNHDCLLNTVNKSYAQITAENKVISHIPQLNSDIHSNNFMREENTIKQSLIQSIKNAELLTNMIITQTTLLAQNQQVNNYHDTDINRTC